MTPNAPSRRDLAVLVGGVILSLLFTALIWWAGQFLQGVPHPPPAGAFAYFWVSARPGLWSRVTAWGLYGLHQVAMWALLYYAQSRTTKYLAGLHPVNIAALAVNAVFILLHFIQTQIWYDGLAQDVSVFTSLGSVVVLLVWVLLMETPRRGLFFGRKVNFGQEIIRFARKYHGYYFSWAIVYTFWYHPMDNSSGHLAGFLYMFLLMLQGSLFFTRVHVNRWWTLVLEVAVLVHGTMVALMQSGPGGFWPMFLFGFLAIFIITQMHGLGWSARTRWILALTAVAGILGVYAFRGWGKLDEVLRIPLIDYPLVFILAGLIWLVTILVRRLRPAAHPVALPKPGNNGQD